MPEILATQLQAQTIGGGSCGSYHNSMIVTKVMALSLGASIYNENSYTKSRLVRYVDLYKACSDSCYSCYSCSDSCYSCYSCSDNPCSYSPCSHTPCNHNPPCSDNPCSDTPCNYSPCGDNPCNDTPICSWKSTCWEVNLPTLTYKGYTGEACWPHGSFHTVGCGGHIVCSNCHDRTKCGCNEVGLNCSGYTGNTACTGIDTNSCVCVQIKICPCLAILAFTGTCSCDGAY